MRVDSPLVDQVFQPAPIGVVEDVLAEPSIEMAFARAYGLATSFRAVARAAFAALYERQCEADTLREQLHALREENRRLRRRGEVAA